MTRTYVCLAQQSLTVSVFMEEIQIIFGTVYSVGKAEERNSDPAEWYCSWYISYVLYGARIGQLTQIEDCENVGQK